MTAQANPSEAFDFIVRRDDLHRCEFRTAPAASSVKLASGQVLLAVDAFALHRQQHHLRRLRRRDAVLELLPRTRGLGTRAGLGLRYRRTIEPPGDFRRRAHLGYLPMSSHFVVDAGTRDGERLRRHGCAPPRAATRSTTSTRAPRPTPATTRRTRPSRCCCGRCSSPAS